MTPYIETNAIALTPAAIQTNAGERDTAKLKIRNGSAKRRYLAEASVENAT
jgi:hypothetical protein